MVARFTNREQDMHTDMGTTTTIIIITTTHLERHVVVLVGFLVVD
jgi:hypothetical protein